MASAEAEIDGLLDELDEAFSAEVTSQPPRARRASAVRPAGRGPAHEPDFTPAPTPQVSQPAVVAMLEMENLRDENARLWALVRLAREVRRLEDLFERRGSRQSDYRAFLQARNQLDAMLLELLGA